MSTYVINPKAGEPFELDAPDVIDAMVDATARVGSVDYSIRLKNPPAWVPFGTVTADGRIQL
jgi:hypothetical protein